MRPSPLAEGRELKYVKRFLEVLHGLSPLAEGRELKFRGLSFRPRRLRSPLAEGRELKFRRLVRHGVEVAVAPRGGA